MSSATEGTGTAVGTVPGADAGTADFDHAATTRVRPEVVEAMAPFNDGRYGNPSGSHLVARDAVRAIDEAREQIAEIVGCSPGDVIFTSGGTEADNHAITGGLPPRSGIPVCSAVEHHAVLDVVEALDGRVVGVDRQGRVDMAELGRTLEELGEQTSVVSVMLVNNEIGTINDLEAVATLVSGHQVDGQKIPVHTDAVQAAAWLDLKKHATHADLISLSAHKLGGPKGMGALIARKSAPVRAMILGGGQERERRSGTPSVAGIVGFAAALSLIEAERDTTTARVTRLRDRLLLGLSERVSGLVHTVDSSDLIPASCHICVEGADSESLLLLLEMGGVMASAGSSCASGARESSHVLAAIGVTDELARGAVRLSLGVDTTDADVDQVLAVLPQAVERVRAFGS
ncbi:MAG: cysteine desulfurase family protein [Microthrixaceae bacterium]